MSGSGQAVASAARERTTPAILHADLDAFFASVEQRDDPSFRGRPVIVGGGVVLAASYEAKRRGVKTAMGGRQARALCPDAIEVPPRFSAYIEASKAVFAIFEDTSPLVEGISIDEAFIDVTGLRRLRGEPEEIARRLRERVRDEVGLAITVGVATTKHLAKVASQVGKPDGLLVVPVGGELAFLHPLPIERLWGVGAKTAEKLHGRGIHLVGDIAALPKPALSSMLGPAAGHHLHALANNLDPRLVRTGVRRRSIGSQSALGRRRRSAADLDAVLVGLVDRVSRRLRKADRVGRTVILRMRFDDFTRASRSHTLDEPTAETPVLLGALRALLQSEIPRLHRDGVTLIGISISNLDDANAVQLTLPFRKQENRVLDAALDDVRAKFGADSLQRAVLVGRHQSWEAPMLPD